MDPEDARRVSKMGSISSVGVIENSPPSEIFGESLEAASEASEVFKVNFLGLFVGSCDSEILLESSPMGNDVELFILLVALVLPGL